MKNLVYLLFLAALAFAVVGYFLDWYHLEKGPGANGNTRFSVDIDSGKIKEDIHRGENKLQETLNRVQK